MAGSFTERLQLVVDATTAGGEAGFARLTGAAERSSAAARDTGETVARAAQRVADAREKEANAADAVRLAERRLDELRERGVTGSRLLDAEQKLEAARRRQHTASRDLTTATNAQTTAERKAASAADDLGDSSKQLDLDLKGVAERAAALVGGLSLADWARDAVTGFAEGARSSQAMATSMNATVEQAGAFLGLVGSVGLELDDLIEIQAEFASKTKDGLTQVGTELQHNNDGTVNWTETLVDTLATLQDIPDATERNRLGFSMFGEEGYKQLSRLLNTGVDVRDALAQIGVPFTEEDVALGREFDQAMLNLDQSAGSAGRTIGRAVLPIITGLIDAGQDLGGIISSIPGPMLGAGAAAVLLGVGMRKAGTDGTFLAGSLARASAAAATFRATAALTGTTSAVMGAGLGGAAAAGKGLLGVLGGPWGVGLLAVAGGVAVVNSAVDDFEADAHRMAVESEDAQQRLGDMAASSHELGEELIDNAGTVESWVASVRGAKDGLDEYGGAAATADDVTGGLIGTLVGTADSLFDLGIAEQEAADEIDRQRDALGKAALQAENAQTVTKTLNDLIAEGTTTGSEFADQVQATAEAQATASHTTDVANAAVAAYNATTRDAIDTMLDLYSAQLGQRSGWQDVLTALQDTANATEDGTTAASEVEQAYIDLMGTVLDYGNSAADAAVEAARAAGTVLDPLTEAQIRADATISALKESLDAPNLTERARGEIQAMIDQLGEAQDEGNIEAILSLTGAAETEGQIDATTKDRETTVTVESRGGPAVDDYLDGLAEARRLAIVRVESRGGPAVRAYLEGLAEAQRLAIIHVESRGGPAVDSYLDSLAARDRLAIIRVETRGGPAVAAYLDELAGAARVASIAAGSGLRGGPGAVAGTLGGGATLGSVTLDLELVGRVPAAQLSKAERGRLRVEEIRAYEARNGTGWRRRT